MKTLQFPMLNSSVWDSKIKSANVTGKERWIGFFFGPAGVILINGVIASYLNLFYTDVMKVGNLWHGMFLMVFPIFSKVVDAITNVIMGSLIDHTRSKQGKARPWILVALPLLVISSILLFTVPNASDTVKIIWIVVSFNVYYSVAYTCYYISHTMLVPLSTRNTRQRDGLAMLSNMAMCLIPGFVVAMLFPMIVLPTLGVDQSKWIRMIVVFSIILIPCIFMEYYFTRERISEESAGLAQPKEAVSITQQAKACVKSKYWIMIMVIMVVNQLCASFQNNSLVYYCNWVLGSYNDGITQTIVSAVGNAPLGFGILIMWPLVRKFGKQKVMVVGLAVDVLGSLLFLTNPTNLGVVLPALMVRAFGALPITYILIAMMADAMDHVEWKAGFRCDGFTTSGYSIIFTVCAGLAQGLFNLGMSRNGYVPPKADGTFVEQTAAVKSFFVFSYMGMYTIGCVIMLVIFWFYRVEKDMPQMKADITARHKAEAEAQGIEYVSPEEAARREQEENDRIAEENRIRELKERCEKKGLDFEAEEAKYQKKLAEQKAKQEAKAAKHKRK